MVWARIRNIIRRQTAALFFAFALLLVGFGASAQSANSYTPQIGQPGKDVIWMPTSERAAEPRVSDRTQFYVRDIFQTDLKHATVVTLRLWFVPASVADTWRWSIASGGAVQHHEFEMNQQFQRVSAVVRVGQRTLRLRDATLRGDQGVRYTHVGRVNGDRIEGEIALSEGGKRLRWAATRMTLKEGNDG